MTQPDLYESRSLLLFQLGRDYIYVPDATGSGVRAPDPGPLATYVNAEMQILDSAPLRLALIDKLGVGTIFPELAADPDARAKAERALNKAMSVSLVTGSYVVDVRVLHSDPAVANSIATALPQVFTDQRATVLSSDPPAFVRDQLAQAETALTAMAADAEAKLGGRSFAAYDDERTIAMTAQGRLLSDLASANAEAAGLEERQKAAEADIDAIAPNQRDPANPVYERAELEAWGAALDLAQMRQKRNALAAEVAKNDAVIADHGARASQIDDQRARITAQHELITRLRVRLSDSEIAAARTSAGAGSLRVIEAGVPSDGPVGMPVRIRVIVAIALGFAVAVLWLLIAFLRQPAIAPRPAPDDRR